MTPYSGLDYYALDDLLTDEERMIRKTVRDFVDREAVPIIEDHHTREAFPRHLIPRMAELGFLRREPEGYGCAGLNNISYGLICQELERCDSGLRSMVSVQGSLCMHPIHAFRLESAESKRWLPAMAAVRRSAASASPSPTTAPIPAHGKPARAPTATSSSCPG